MTDASGLRPLRFAIVTSTHIANNPRVVKEADALAAAGHAVRVIALRQRAAWAERDDALMCDRRWRLHRVDVDPTSVRGKLRWLCDGALAHVARELGQRGIGGAAVGERLIARHTSALARAAVAEPADIVIAHYYSALPAARRAARALGARLAFDVEDLHTGETDSPGIAPVLHAVAQLEREVLPECDFITASSDGIADEVARRYGVTRPQVVLNSFPLAERAASAPDDRPVGARVSIYWYSQVIGRNRGLEDAVAALAMLDADVHLVIRGEREPAFIDWLQRTAGERGVAARVHLRETVRPDLLVALAAQHDVGLALEPTVSLNRQLCVSNKLLTYLVAGIAVAATDTPAQRAVLSDAAGAGILYPPGDAEALAHGLRRWTDDDVALAAAKRASTAAAERRFSWELEAKALVRYYEGNGARDSALEPR